MWYGIHTNIGGLESLFSGVVKRSYIKIHIACGNEAVLYREDLKIADCQDSYQNQALLILLRRVLTT